MCHERGVIQEKSMRSFVFPKQLNHIAPTKGLVSFWCGTNGFENPFEFNVKWGGTKVPPFLWPKGDENPGLSAFGGRSSVLVFVEEEVLFGRVIGPNVLDRVERLAVILQLLKVLHHFQRRTGSHREVDELVLGGGPRGVLEV